MNRLFIAALFAVFMTACGTVTHWGKRPDFTNISIGMSQAEVINRMGKPEDISAKDGLVVLRYSYAPWHDHSGADGNKEIYFVRLINDKVESFGKMGDFDSTKPPEQTININLNNGQ